ncbi:MAG: TetR/AcrR family transcriptional regulator [Bacteroidota bacterium]
MNKDLATEERIFKAARKVFQQRGLQGSRMQEIAEVAGIHRSVLNYYYRTKKKLYDEVVKRTVKEVVPRYKRSFVAAQSTREILEGLIHAFFDQYAQEPELATFYAITLQENPELIFEILEEYNFDAVLELFNQWVEQAIQKGEIRNVNPRFLLGNINSMCAYPFISRPMILRNMTEDGMSEEAFFNGLKEEIVTLVWNGIKKD